MTITANEVKPHRWKLRSQSTQRPCRSPAAPGEARRCVQVIGMLRNTAERQERTDEPRNATAAFEAWSHRRKSRFPRQKIDTGQPRLADSWNNLQIPIPLQVQVFAAEIRPGI